jgi:hypothetical protein
MHQLIGSVTSQEPIGHYEVVPSRTRSPAPKRPEADAPVPFRRGCAPRVDGKFLSRGGRRLRVQELISGPFSPGDDGNPFPRPARHSSTKERCGPFNSTSRGCPHASGLAGPGTLDHAEPRQTRWY